MNEFEPNPVQAVYGAPGNLSPNNVKKKNGCLKVVVIAGIVFFSFFLIIGGIMAVFSGVPSEAQGKSKPEYIVAKLSEKYDDEFEYIGPGGGATWMSDFNDYVLKSKKYPEGYVSVDIYDKYNFYDSSKWRDNYLALSYIDVLEQIIYEIAVPIYGECVVWTSPRVGPDLAYTENMTFEEFAALSSCQCNTYIFITKSDASKEKDLESMILAMKQKKIFSYLYFCYVDTLPSEAITVSNIQQLENKTRLEGSLMLSENYTIISKRWGID